MDYFLEKLFKYLTRCTHGAQTPPQPCQPQTGCANGEKTCCTLLCPDLKNLSVNPTLAVIVWVPQGGCGLFDGVHKKARVEVPRGKMHAPILI